MCASSLLPAAHSTQWLNLTGHQLAQRYGMSEVLTVIANPLQPGQAKQGQSVSQSLCTSLSYKLLLLPSL